jgi:Mn2+/Fe2+ NRAMP family transporter
MARFIESCGPAPRATGSQNMRRQLRLKDAMQWVAILAIYLAAFHFFTQEPSNDPLTTWAQMISGVLLFFILPFHLMLAWGRSR